jgi:hypothetical protein
MRIILLVLSISVTIVSCMKQRKAPQAEPITQRSQPPVVTVGNDTMLYYSRGACFGMCPIFELTVMRDGRATYVGKNHVDRIGRYQSRVSYTDVEHVMSKAKEIGYFEMQPVFDNENVHDLPDIKTAIAHEGKLHRVRNRYKGPASLRYLYNELDSLIEKQQWQPTGSNQE